MLEALEYVKIRLMGMAKTERGASAVEYGLLVSLIAIAIIAAVFLLGGKLSAVFTQTNNSLTSRFSGPAVIAQSDVTTLFHIEGSPACLVAATGARGGATSVEYPLLIALIAIAIVVAVTLLGNGTAGLFRGLRLVLAALGGHHLLK